jgi:hypothetical protein
MPKYWLTSDRNNGGVGNGLNTPLSLYDARRSTSRDINFSEGNLIS